MPRFQPRPLLETEAATERLADFCRGFAAQPEAPPTVPLRARVRRPLPLGLTRLLGMRRLALGPVPGIRGWAVRWPDCAPDGRRREAAYLVTPSGRTYLLGRGNEALFSDRHGFPPQPNPVSAADAARIEQNLRALLAAPSGSDT